MVRTGRSPEGRGEVIWRLALLLLMAGSSVDDSVAQVTESGRVVDLADPPSERLNPGLTVEPGAPPVLSFRYFDAADRGRFGNLGLMTDDAGH